MRHQLMSQSTETQPKTPSSKHCRCRSTVAGKNSLERTEPRKNPREEPGYEGWASPLLAVPGGDYNRTTYYPETRLCIAPTPLEGYLPTYYPETRLSIAHKDLLHHTGPRGRKTGQEDHVCDSTLSSDAPLLGTAWKSTSKPVTQPL